MGGSQDSYDALNIGLAVASAGINYLGASNPALGGNSGGEKEKPKSEVSNGTTVYRVYGGESGPDGKSWTTIDPRTVQDYSNAAGLPPQNTGEYLSIGELIDNTGVTTRNALQIGSNTGGLFEVVIPNPSTQVEVFDVFRFIQKN
jgi:hypothetical protein